MVDVKPDEEPGLDPLTVFPKLDAADMAAALAKAPVELQSILRTVFYKSSTLKQAYDGSPPELRRYLWTIGGFTTFLVLLVDLTKVLATSTFASLFYYAPSERLRPRLKAPRRKYPKTVPTLGTVTRLLSLALVFFTQEQAWTMGVSGLGAGALMYTANERFSKDGHSQPTPSARNG